MGSSLPGPIVVPYPPVAPPTATVVDIYADTPLELSQATSPHDTDHTIANGKTFCVQRVIIGAGHDPSEKGSMTELIYDDNGTEHIVARYFVENQTFIIQLADVSKARDGTVMTGNGTNKRFTVRRTRLSSAGQMVDVHVQGYEE